MGPSHSYISDNPKYTNAQIHKYTNTKSAEALWVIHIYGYLTKIALWTLTPPDELLPLPFFRQLLACLVAALGWLKNTEVFGSVPHNSLRDPFSLMHNYVLHNT